MTVFRGALLGGLFFLVSFNSEAQRYATASGNWTGGIWATTPAGVPGSALTPTSADDVFTNGFSVTVDVANVFCRNLNVRNQSNSLILNDNAITISGVLSGVDNTNSIAFPTLSDILLMTDFGELIFNATSGSVVNRWRYANPLTNVTFNPGVGNSVSLTSGLRIVSGGVLTIQSGTLTTTSSINREIRGASDCTISVSAGATLNIGAAINGGGTTFTAFAGEELTSIGTVNVSGTLIAQNYVNSQNVNVSASGIFRCSFNGATQTQGWWYQSSSPSGSTSLVGGIEFNATSNQNVPGLAYGSLTLSGSGVKTVTFANLTLTGDLTVTGSSMTSPFLVTFSGSAVQAISGGGSCNFNGGLTINKSGGALTLSQSVAVQGTFTLSAGTVNLGSNTVTLSGDLVNNGVLAPGSSNFIFSSSTTISGTSSTSLNNLTISGSGTLIAPANLGVAGNFSNSGVFNANGGSVTFNGTTSQSVTGTSTFNNINCNTTGGGSVAINGNVTLSGVLTLSSVSAIFDADGSGSGVFTIASTSQNAGGRIAALPNPGNFSGDVTVQRFIHSQAGGDYRYLSMPITTNQNNLSRWKAAIGVTGAFSDRSVNSEFANIQDSGNTNPSVFTWNGTAYVAVTGGTTGATTLSSRTGYVAYNYNNGSVTASYRGDIETGSVPISISNVNGNFNLVPNPYPSPIDFDNVSKSNINNSLWLRTGNNTFSSYVGGVATLPPFVGWGGEIAIGQSFWTQSNGGGSTLTLNETDKTNNSVRFLRTETPTNYVRLTLTGADQLDEAVIRFADGGSDDLNGKFDAVKRKNGNYVSAFGQNNYLNLSVYTVSAAIDYAIKGIAPLSATEATRIVPLKVADAKNGNYTLKFTELSTFDLGYKIFLKDKFLSKEVEIEDNEEYEFSITSNASTTGSARFELVFRKDIVTALEPTLSQEVLVYPNPVSSDGRLTIVIPEQLDAPILSIFLYDMKGSVIYSSENDKKILEPGVKTIEMGQAGTGLYILNITSGNEIKSIRVLKR